MPRNHFSGDPYWFFARYPGKCAGCGAPFGAGDRVFRFKAGQMFAEACGCGKTESDAFNAAAEDEYLMTGPLTSAGGRY